MKYGVQTATNRCKWVCAGVGGCVRAQETRGAQKQAKKGAFMDGEASIWALWPGKFPRTWCFWGFVKNGQKWVRMDSNGWGWMQWGAWSRGKGKTRQKEAEMGLQGMFLHVWPQVKNAACWYRWSLRAERVKWMNEWGTTGRALRHNVWKQSKIIKQTWR